MNRCNFFKGVLGSLAACVVGKIVPSRLSKIEQWWKGAYPGCHNVGVPYRIFVCRDFDKQVNSVELEDYKLRLKRYIAITGYNLKVVDVANCD